jgi:hypothetical protein
MRVIAIGCLTLNDLHDLMGRYNERQIGVTEFVVSNSMLKCVIGILGSVGKASGVKVFGVPCTEEQGCLMVWDEQVGRQKQRKFLK